jgi:hypothetical protein
VRLRASVGGLLFVTAAALWHRSPMMAGRAGAAESDTCSGAFGSRFCGAVAGLSTALNDPSFLLHQRGILPPAGTPGATDPAVTQANITITVCRPGYSRAVRPPYAITGPFKRRLMDVQHPGERMADYELDHLIPISLGGAPFDTRDLWLQPRNGQANAAQKNALAYILWRLVCEHRLPLRTAQRAISHNWIQAFATYATPDNLARYRFQTPDFGAEEPKGAATIPSEEGVSHATEYRRISYHRAGRQDHPA